MPYKVAKPDTSKRDIWNRFNRIVDRPGEIMRRVGKKTKFKRFLRDVSEHTPLLKLVILLVLMWAVFSTSLFFVERNEPNATITGLGEAFYWGIAAFSTAGIADTPVSGWGQLLGGIWIVLGSMLFFGTIVATVTSYFMRPLQRPHKKIIETIEYNLEQLDDLTLDELDILKDTVDTLITHMEELKEKQEKLNAKEEKLKEKEEKTKKK